MRTKEDIITDIRENYFSMMESDFIEDFIDYVCMKLRKKTKEELLEILKDYKERKSKIIISGYDSHNPY